MITLLVLAGVVAVVWIFRDKSECYCDADIEGVDYTYEDEYGPCDYCIGKK